MTANDWPDTPEIRATIEAVRWERASWATRRGRAWRRICWAWRDLTG